MPTPAYTNLNSNKPAGTDSPTTYATDNLNNIRALRDMVITGRAAGFVQTRTQGTGPDVARPQYITWLNSTLQIGFRMKSTWGGTGNCQQTSVEWEWTNDNAASWTTLGTAQANTFDANDNITATTNSGGLVALVMEMWTKLLRYVGAIKVDAATNNIGLGATAPTNERLLIKASNTTGSSVYDYINCSNEVDCDFKVRVSGTASTDKRAVIGVASSASLELITNSLPRMRINSSGDVGIGTSSPGAKLDLLAADNLTTRIRIGATQASAASAIAVSEVFGTRNDSNNTFYGRFAASFRRCDATAIASGQPIGALLFGGQHGTDTSFQSAKLLYTAGILGVAEGSFTGSTAMATGIAIHTGSTGGDIGAANSTFGTERMRITSDGRIYGTALHNNAGSVTGTANQYIASGTMANGNATAVTNVSGTPTYQTMTWMRVGNVVTCAGTVTAGATTANTACTIRFPLPIASGFTATEDCAGTGIWTTGDNGEPVRVTADVTNDQASVRWVPTNTTITVIPIHFTYLIK